MGPPPGRRLLGAAAARDRRQGAGEAASRRPARRPCRPRHAVQPTRPGGRAACPAGWDAERIIGCAHARDWPGLIALGRVLTRRSGHPMTRQVGALTVGLYRLGRTLRSVLANRGVSVTVVGPDGGARSALVAELLSERWLRARLVHRRLAGRYHRLRGRTVVFDTHPAASSTGTNLASLGVIEVEARSPVTDDVLAGAVNAVWCARSGQPAVATPVPGAATTARSPGRARPRRGTASPDRRSRSRSGRTPP